MVDAEYQVEAGDSVGPSLEEIRDLWAQLQSTWAVRNAEYSRARRLYRGEHWNAEENPAPTNRYSLTANYLKQIVDKDVQILMGTLPGIQVLPPSAEAGGRAFAERLEGLLYGMWKINKAHQVFLNVTHNSVVLRRGIMYYWWDFNAGHFRFRSCTPDNFYPVYDGDEIVEAIYVSRRLTRTLRTSYPELAEQIFSDGGAEYVYEGPSHWSKTSGGVTDALGDGGEPRGDHALGYTTVLDYYDRDGAWVRVMGDAVWRQNLQYPCAEVPFIEVLNGVAGEEREPSNAIDDIAELNMYYDQILSQRADVIRKWSNPPVIDRGSGVAPGVIKQTLGGDGGILPINPRGGLELLTWQGTMPEVSEQMAEIKEAIYDLSGKPRSAFGQTITNQSGVMTNLALTPTLQSNELRETLYGWAFAALNEVALQMYEKFAAAKEIRFKGTRMGKTPKNRVYYEVAITGREINGWYENRMKWPSAIRVDDPAFVQSELAKLQSKPQAQSIYDTLENLGVEDVEAYIDRIRAEHEDPRIHPEIMQQAIDSLVNLSGAMMPPGMASDAEAMMGTGAPGGGLDQGAYNEQMIESGVPLTAGE